MNEYQAKYPVGGYKNIYMLTCYRHNNLVEEVQHI